ncbi:pyruvate, phosphate dikinase [Candidatus Latescibacterota bacterium]
MSDKYVYLFGGGISDGRAEMKNLLGGKGANLAEMSKLGIPVPAGFTITTEMCTVYYKMDRNYPPELLDQIKEGVRHIEKTMGKEFNDPENPLLLSVRSGARVSMPGMMDTVLNLGLNDTTVKGLAKVSGNERFAYDSYRRFVQMYGDVVLGMKPESKEEEDPFEVIIDAKKKEVGVEIDTDLSTEDLKDLVEKFKALIKEKKGIDFPEEPEKQLWGSINAVFGSWNGARAITYRNINGIPHDWGTAVNVQSMVFGNMGDDCATGVAFTRDPATGKNRFFGEYLVNAQGEDVVAGTRTPQPVNDSSVTGEGQITLESLMPGPYKTLEEIYLNLENHYRDMQDIEFTIEKGKLWMLQTRTGKRTVQAALKIAVDMVEEKMIDEKTAILRIEPEQLDQLLHPMFDKDDLKNATVLGKGLPASPGAATGKVVFHADDAVEQAENGEKVILVRIETSPEDIGGMNAAQGILTARGGRTSHAAVVARGMGKCCVAGCSDIVINYAKAQFTAGGEVINAGDYISLDGTSGEVLKGKVKTVDPEISGDFGTFMAWADLTRRLKVRTNADTPGDARKAVEMGAEGIGLCRTEHMFFEGDRIKAVREMILADNHEGRIKALAKLEPMQKNDFIGIFEAMQERPVTIRLLDPPLHEFLPHEEEQQREMAEEMGVSFETIKNKVESLHEFNPMLGNRGCRLGIKYNEISEMQMRAIFAATVECHKNGLKVVPEVMIPLIGTVKEYTLLRDIAVRIADETKKSSGVDFDYMVGTMIEIPRAALTADEIGAEAQFFSFGTNDLTQMTFGFSRDDIGSFIKVYLDNGVLPSDPFLTLDQKGVGQLVEMGIKKGRSARPKLKVGICGEHGGDPASVEFCHRIGMDYVSCSPFRVPIARLAAAQAVVKEK